MHHSLLTFDLQEHDGMYSVVLIACRGVGRGQYIDRVQAGLLSNHLVHDTSLPQLDSGEV